MCVFISTEFRLLIFFYKGGSIQSHKVLPDLTHFINIYFMSIILIICNCLLIASPVDRLYQFRIQNYCLQELLPAMTKLLCCANCTCMLFHCNAEAAKYPFFTASFIPMYYKPRKTYSVFTIPVKLGTQVRTAVAN